MVLPPDQPRTFARAFEETNVELEKVIADVNSLSGEIARSVQSTSSSSAAANEQNVVRIPEEFESSVALIQELLADTREKFVKMLEDNNDLAFKLDDNVSDCRKDITTLRSEMRYMHRCLSDLEDATTVSGSAPESEQTHTPEALMEIQIYRLRDENGRLQLQVRSLRDELVELRKLLEAENSRGQHGVRSTQCNGGRSSELLNGNHDQNGNDESEEVPKVSKHPLSARSQDWKTKIAELQNELLQTKDAISALNDDRKRLKVEKVELLNQMKEIYCTLENKERELRDFIRQYEQKMKDSDKGLKELIVEKEHLDRERKQLEASVQDASEKIVQLQKSLTDKELENLNLQRQLKEACNRLGPDSATHGRTPSLGYASLPVSPACCVDGGIVVANGAPKSTTVASAKADSSAPKAERRYEGMKRELSSSDELSVGGVAPATSKAPKKTRGRRDVRNHEVRSSSASRFSRIFGGISSHKDEMQDLNDDSEQTDEHPIAADISLAEKADCLLEARRLPLSDWKQSHVIAWLELELGMHCYKKAFVENVKSGRLLMSISDGEIESILKVAQPLHKRKLRLAIDDYRSPSLNDLPQIREVTSQYVCNHFLASIGLQQHAESFRRHIVDGRLLNQFNKKQLEKYLGISRKFHQLSVLRAVDLLRKLKFDTKALTKRRSDCEKENVDLLVWTNARLMKWLKQIDLQEYAENLVDTGVHGAVVVLEQSFSADTLAHILRIPHGKHLVRKHLTTEFGSLLVAARAPLIANDLGAVRKTRVHRANQHTSQPSRTASSSLGRSLSRSFAAGLSSDTDDAMVEHQASKRSSFRGSFGRIFGLKATRRATTGELLFTGDAPHELLDAEVSKAVGHSVTSPALAATCGESRSCANLAEHGRSEHMRAILSTDSQLLSPSIANGQLRAGASTSSDPPRLLTVGQKASPAKSRLIPLADESCDSAVYSGATAGSNSSTTQSRSSEASSCGHEHAVAPVVLRDRTPKSANALRPHSVAEWSLAPKQPVDDRQKAGRQPLQLPSFSSDQLSHWLALEDVKARGGTAKVTASTSTSLVLTPPISKAQNARAIGTIRESELEAAAAECTPAAHRQASRGVLVKETGDRHVDRKASWQAQVAAQSAGELSPSRRLRPKSLPIRDGRARCASFAAFDENVDVIKLDLIETDL